MLENFRAQKIIWDRANKKIFENIETNSGDSNGRKLVVQVINQEASENLSGTTLSLGWKSRNGAKGLDAFKVVDASKGIFEIYYTTEMLSNIGNIEASLILIDSTSRIESSTFTISVRPSTVDDQSVESENSFTALTEALVKVSDLEGNYAPRLNEVTAQLAQKATKEEVQAVASGSPKGTYATLTALQTAFPAGNTNIYLVIADGNWYYWSGSAWESGGVYQSTGIADNSIKPENTTFISSTKNKFNKNDVIKGAYINNANVVTSGTSASGFDCHTGYIEVIAGETYHRNKLSNVLMYDENYVFSNILTPNTGTFTPNKWVSGSIKYIRMSMAEADLDEFQLELGSVETSYEPYGLKINDLISEIDVGDLPNLNQNIPEYFQTEILNTVQKVEDVTTEPSLVLSILTDSHSDQMGDNFKYLKETANNIAEVNKYIQSDAIIHLGDLVAGTLTLSDTKKSIRNVTSELRNTSRPLFTLRGNHDDNSYGVDSSIENLLLSDTFYSMGTRQTNIYNNVYRNASSNYGYIDYEQHKIRVIMLDAIDYPYVENGEGGLTYNGKNWWGYGTEQILWFGHTALKVEEGWGVVVLSHTPSRESHSLINRSVPYNSNLIEGLLKAFKNGTIYTANTTGAWGVSDTFDFTTQGQRDVIAYVFGHTHMDLVDTPIDLGYPCVSIANNVPVQIYETSVPVGGVAPTRTIGTVTQDLWNVMVVRKDIRTVFLTRYGAGEDRTFTY